MGATGLGSEMGEGRQAPGRGCGGGSEAELCEQHPVGDGDGGGGAERASQRRGQVCKSGSQRAAWELPKP